MKIANKVLKKHTNEFILLAIFIGIVLLMGALSPDKFFSVSNFTTMAFQMPEFGLLALGMMAVILTGGINLSITSTAMLSGIGAAFILSSDLTKASPVLGIVLAVLFSFGIAVLTGLFNGFFVAYVGVAAMLVTLGSMTLFEGIGLNLTKGGSISGFPAAFMKLGGGDIFGIPIPLLIYVVAIVVAYFMLERSNWGTKVYFTGCNEIATRFSGINTKMTLLKVYVFSSMLASVAGLVIISRYNSAKVDYGSSYMMQSVAAVVLGGTSINGGHGTVAGTVIAVAIIQVISTGLNLYGLNRYIIDIITGAVLIGVLAIRFFSGKRAASKLVKSKEEKAA
ncbi:MAG: ABC transporter permease [Oscillospiraceae bacterium]